MRSITDVIAPSVLLLILGSGWYICTFEVAIGWIFPSSPIAASFYLVAHNSLLALLLYSFLHLILLPEDHDRPSKVPSRGFATRSIPFEALDSSTSIRYCKKGSCNGRWKPPRAHHCSSCGVCRIGLDHHCPWIGTCVTWSQMKRFLQFLLIVPITVAVSLAPFSREVWHHTLTAYRASRSDSWTRSNWWSWPWSWIVGGGPVGRYFWGTVAGYRILQQAGETSHSLGAMVIQPRITTMVFVVVATLLALFAAIMAIGTWIAVCKGETSIDQLKRSASRKSGKSRLLWVPVQETHNVRAAPSVPDGTTGFLLPVLSHERLYDLGWRQNIQTCSKTCELAEINPSILMRAYAGSYSDSGSSTRPTVQ